MFGKGFKAWRGVRVVWDGVILGNEFFLPVCKKAVRVRIECKLVNILSY